MKFTVYGIEDGTRPERLKSFDNEKDAKEYSDRVWAVDDDYDRMEIRKEES